LAPKGGRTNKRSRIIRSSDRFLGLKTIELGLFDAGLAGVPELRLGAVFGVLGDEHVEVADPGPVLVGVRLLNNRPGVPVAAAEDSEIVLEARDGVHELGADVDELLEVAFVVPLVLIVGTHRVELARVDAPVQILVGLQVPRQADWQLLQQLVVVLQQQQALLLLYLHILSSLVQGATGPLDHPNQSHWSPLSPLSNSWFMLASQPAKDRND
jgi:hypothetical protein